jgi:outer membrane protein
MKSKGQSLIGMTLMFALLYALADSASRPTTNPLGTSRVGFVDIPTIMAETVFVRELKTKIKVELDDRLKQYEAKQREYAKLVQDIKRQQSVLSESAVDAKYRQAFLLKAQLDEEKYTIEKFLNESEKRELLPAHNRILEMVQEVARDEGCDVVLRRELLIYGHPSVDITAEVIARLNNAPRTPGFGPQILPASPSSGPSAKNAAGPNK